MHIRKDLKSRNTKNKEMFLFADNLQLSKEVKPFLKWAGGKGQLIQQFEEYFPKELKAGLIENYYEPFLGGGAVFFHISNKYKIKKAFLYDINDELIITYLTIKNAVDDLLINLKELKEEYLSLNFDDREKFFYNIRNDFNKDIKIFNYKSFSSNWINRTTQLLFLNKTCFNGLFRLNSKGEFNVPFGKYRNPSIYDEVNIRNASLALQYATIEKRSFHELPKNITGNSFIYFDPPYRPLNKTASFTSYSKFDFTDKEQIELAELFKKLSKQKKIKLMLSNADPHNENINDDFFIKHYTNIGININKVFASRMINSDATKRGKITELIIRNYK